MRFFKSCRIVKRTRAREMLFRRYIIRLLVNSVGLAPRTSSPWASNAAKIRSLADPRNRNAPT